MSCAVVISFLRVNNLFFMQEKTKKEKKKKNYYRKSDRFTKNTLKYMLVASGENASLELYKQES